MRRVKKGSKTGLGLIYVPSEFCLYFTHRFKPMSFLRTGRKHSLWVQNGPKSGEKRVNCDILCMYSSVWHVEYARFWPIFLHPKGTTLPKYAFWAILGQFGPLVAYSVLNDVQRQCIYADMNIVQIEVCAHVVHVCIYALHGLNDVHTVPCGAQIWDQIWCYVCTRTE